MYPGVPDTYVNSASLKLTATDSGCAGVKSIEYREQGSTDWLPYTAAVDFTAAKKYTIEYRSTDKKDNVSAVKTATFEILAINDDDAPRRPRPPRPATSTSAASSSAPPRSR